MKGIGVALLGGKSKRFGLPKALAKLGDKTFTEIALEVLSDVVDSVIVSASSSTPTEALKIIERFGVEVTYDKDLPCRGPLRGLLSSLEHVSGFDYIVVLGVDYPFLRSETLKSFVKISQALSFKASTPLPFKTHPSITIGYATPEALEKARKACMVKRDFARLTDLYRCSPSLLLIGWRILSSSPKEFISVNKPDQLKAKVVNIEEIRDIIEIENNQTCYKALNYIEKKEYENAVRLLREEIEMYRRFKVRLFEEHAEKDMRYLIELISSR